MIPLLVQTQTGDLSQPFNQSVLTSSTKLSTYFQASKTPHSTEALSITDRGSLLTAFSDQFDTTELIVKNTARELIFSSPSSFLQTSKAFLITSASSFLTSTILSSKSPHMYPAPSAQTTTMDAPVAMATLRPSLNETRKWYSTSYHISMSAISNHVQSDTMVTSTSELAVGSDHQNSCCKSQLVSMVTAPTILPETAVWTLMSSHKTLSMTSGHLQIVTKVTSIYSSDSSNLQQSLDIVTPNVATVKTKSFSTESLSEILNIGPSIHGRLISSSYQNSIIANQNVSTLKTVPLLTELRTQPFISSYYSLLTSSDTQFVVVVTAAGKPTVSRFHLSSRFIGQYVSMVTILPSSTEDRFFALEYSHMQPAALTAPYQEGISSLPQQDPSSDNENSKTKLLFPSEASDSCFQQTVFAGN